MVTPSRFAESHRRRVVVGLVLHSNGDAMDVAVADGRIVGVRGRPDDGTGAVGQLRRVVEEFMARGRTAGRLGRSSGRGC
ncbi:hypothetical protein Scel_17610 [Streptomyces cellostaticus]|nr:hypothetical protein Scel_17610 [Streptomyces cellostaticus]